MKAGARWLLIAAALATGGSAVADPAGWPSGSLDPGRVETLKASEGADPLPEVRCTVYADLIVRESGTESPSPDPATILRLGRSATPPACARTVPPGAVALKTADFSFVGRKGPYLFFEATDPNGAIPVMVVEAASAASYRKAKVPADDPSVVAFEVDLRFANGHAESVQTGPIGCEPLP